MDEYISKESAISIFRAKAEMAVCTPAQPYFDCAAKMLELLPAADVAPVRHGRWVPVTERMPEKYQTVVGWCKDNPFSKYKEEIVCWNGKGWVFLYGQRYVTNVTHWMPLPEPPEPQKEDTP